MNEAKIIKIDESALDDRKQLSRLANLFSEEDIKATALLGEECTFDFYEQLKSGNFPLARIKSCTDGLIGILSKVSLSERDTLTVVNIAWDCQQYLEGVVDVNTLDDSEYEWLRNDLPRDKHILSEVEYQKTALRLLKQIKIFLERGDLGNSYLGYLHLSFLT